METPRSKDAGQTPAPESNELKKQKSEQDAKTASQKRHTGTLIVVAGGVIILALGFSAGWLSRHESSRYGAGPNNVRMHEMFAGGQSPTMKQHMGGDDINATDGTTVLRLTGVVTQVGSDTFTIAGNGTTKTIKTTGDTTYSVSTNKVSVNDSVSVRGTQNGDTFTATAVVVLNR